MVVTDNEKVRNRLVLLRNYGSAVKYYHDVEGGNHRLDTLQAGVLNIKLAWLDRWNQKRNRLAGLYDAAFSDIPQVKVLPSRKGADCVYHLYVIRVAERDKLKHFLDEKEIGTGIHYRLPFTSKKPTAIWVTAPAISPSQKRRLPKFFLCPCIRKCPKNTFKPSRRQFMSFIKVGR